MFLSQPLCRTWSLGTHLFWSSLHHGLSWQCCSFSFFFFFPSHFIYLFFLSLYSSLILVSHTYMFNPLKTSFIFMCSISTYVCKSLITSNLFMFCNSNKKHTNVKNVTLNSPPKDIWFESCTVLPDSNSSGNMWQATQIFHCSMNNHASAASIEILGLETEFRK